MDIYDAEKMPGTDADGGKIPNQKELEKELSDYLSKKYGNRVKVISPFVVPRKEEAARDDAIPETLRDPARIRPVARTTGIVPGQLRVKQDDAKAVLATKICTHFNRIAHYARTSEKRRAPASA